MTEKTLKKKTSKPKPKSKPRESKPSNNGIITSDGIKVFCEHTELRDPAVLIPNPKNPNQHPEDQITLLSRIIKAQGWRAPITVSDRSGFIVRGHGRLAAAIELNLTEAPVDVQNYDTEAEEYADMVADNRLAELSMMDNDLLYNIIDELTEEGFNLDLTGYLDEEIDKIRAEHFKEKDGLTDPDELPEFAAKDTFVKQGEIWLLGDKHKLICGDSTDRETLTRLMGKEHVGMIFTDPPYNVDYVPEDQPRSEKSSSDMRKYKAGGIMQDDGDFDTIAWLDAVETYMRQGAFYICSGGKEAPLIHNWILERIAPREPTYIIWAKNSFSLSRRDYHRQHEFIFYSWLKDKHWAGTRNESDLWWADKNIVKEMDKESLVKLYYEIIEQTDVWDIHRDPVQEYVHPTQKPVALAKRAMRFSSRPKEIVVDFFAGSGSTIIAAEQMDRICYSSELDPYYCSVTLLRYFKFTGVEPIRDDGIALSEIMDKE